MDRAEPDPEALARCVQDAIYPVPGEATSWSSGIGRSIRHDQQRRAAEAYARRYFAEHGHLPVGTRHVVIAAKPSHGPTFEADVTFPRKVRPR